MPEHIFYNSLNAATDRNYRLLGDLKTQHRTWEASWRHLASTNTTDISPEKEWERLQKHNIRLVLREDALYPRLLQETAYPPFGIYVIGELPPQEKLSIAVVGTRKATEEGKEMAHDFSASLASAGATIISGLAFGIDAAAHRGALDARGTTIAVLANGLDRIYPRSNDKLAKMIIAQNGALVSEYPIGSPTLPYRFLERNRIVSGFSRGTLVIEAPRSSGALATARFALDQNREVFVIPGPIRHPNFKGSHYLIKSGAQLVTAPEDILETFGIATARKSHALAAETHEEEVVIKLLEASRAPLTVDKIIELTNLKARAVNQTLSFLTIKNIVKEDREGYSLTA